MSPADVERIERAMLASDLKRDRLLRDHPGLVLAVLASVSTVLRATPPEGTGHLRLDAALASLRATDLELHLAGGPIVPEPS